MEARDELVAMETRYWQALLEQDTNTALSLLDDPLVKVDTLGVKKLGHAEFRDMASEGHWELREYHLSDMDVEFPIDDVAVLSYAVKQMVGHRGRLGHTTQNMADTATWVRKDGAWRCAMRTETEVT